jgi:hypothetical protein
MNTTYPDYTQLIDQLVEAFGTTPGQALHTELENLYQRHPAVTLAKAREATNAHTAGRIHSPWGFLQAELRRHDQAREQKPQAGREREDAIHRAERWIRNAGLHTTADEALAELFKPTEHTPPHAYLQQLEEETRGNPGRPTYDGLLRAAIRRTAQHGPQPVPQSAGTLNHWDEPDLRERILDLWRTLQPQAEATRQAAIDRGQAWQQVNTPPPAPDGVPL